MAFNNTRIVVGRYRGFKEGNGLRTVGAKNQSVLNFTVVVNNRIKKGDTWEDGPAEWINCVAWGKLAENIANHWVENDNIILIGEMGMKEGYEGKDGKEYPARPELNVQVGGHDDSYFPSTQSKPKNGTSNSSSRTNSSSSHDSNTSTRKSPSKPSSNNDELDIDGIDLDLDFDTPAKSKDDDNDFPF